MINFELKQAEIPADELYEIFQGCAARNSQSEKRTIRSFAFTEREEALSILKKRSCIIEKETKVIGIRKFSLRRQNMMKMEKK